MRDQVAGGTDEDLEAFLFNLARRKMLIAEASRSGLEPPRARVDSLTGVVRAQLLLAGRSLGLATLDQAPGEDRRIAIARAVRQALADNLSGATSVVPLGLVGFQLRQGVPITISSAGVGRSVLRIAQVRAARGPSPLEQSLDTAAATGAAEQAPATPGP